MSDANRTWRRFLLAYFTFCWNLWRIVIVKVYYISEWIFVFSEAQLV